MITLLSVYDFGYEHAEGIDKIHHLLINQIYSMSRCVNATKIFSEDHLL